MSWQLGYGPPAILRLTTAQRDTLAEPAEGTMVYNLTTHRLEVWDGTQWRVVTWEP